MGFKFFNRKGKVVPQFKTQAEINDFFKYSVVREVKEQKPILATKTQEGVNCALLTQEERWELFLILKRKK